MESNPRSAAIYVRISRDDTKDAAGVRRQEEDCRALAARLGYSVAQVFSDNDRGASTRSRKPRPAYADMLRRAKAGEFAALLAYSTSRLTRRPLENEDLIALVEQHGVQIKTVVSGDYRLDTADGRAVARTLAAWDAAEAERTAERVQRAVLQRAQEGKRHGRSAWGWKVVDGAEQLDPDTAPVLQELARRTLAGETLRSLAADLNNRGVPTPNGTRWNGTVLRQVLLRERNAGRRTYRGTVVAQGQWPPILSESEQDQLTALLRDPSRRTARGTEVRYLMSGLLLCGKCGARMRSQVGPKFTRKDGTGGRRPWTYACAQCFGTRAKAADVDEAVTALVVRRLSQADGPVLLSQDQDAAQAAADELAGLRARLDRAADDYADGVIEADQLARITARLRPQIAEAEQAIQRTMPSPALAAFAQDAARVPVADAWADQPLDVQRAVLQQLVTFTLLPRGSGNGWDPARLRPDWHRPQ
ncbi:recombinase family protein [Brachybacterium sp. GCM10030252]|uniref:recombinase family protein n=1 Tax=Brachybacterium sp. GCM10030252 TaxID=3273380 RepID=UPI0036220C1F